MEELLKSKKKLLEVFNEYYTQLYNYQHELEENPNKKYLSLEQLDSLVDSKLPVEYRITSEFIPIQHTDNWRCPRISPAEIKSIFEIGALGELIAEKAIGQIDFSEDEFLELMQHPGFYLIYS